MEEYMAVSKWFDYNGYMANKLAQLQKADSAADWDMVKLVKAFADAGFVGAEGAEAHFEQHGQYEDVAPNAFFNATEYYRAKAAQLYGKDPKAVTDLEAAAVQLAIKDAGLSAWNHYEQFGTTEKVNPSNSFDTEAYMNAKLTALNSVKDGKQYTLADVYAAFKAAGLSALEHFMAYGGNGDGEVAQKYEGKIPAEFAVPEAKKVNPGGGSSDGDTYTLTTGIDNFMGTAGNDTFIGDNVGASPTIQAADQIDGGAGVNTAKFYYAAAAGVEEAILPTMKNIQQLELHGGKLTNGASRDFSGLAGVTDVAVIAPATMATNSDAFTFTLGADQTLSLTKVNAGDSAASGSAINLNGASTVNINAVGTTKGTLTLDVADATASLALNAVGAASTVTLKDTGAALTKLSLTGDQDVDVTADANVTKLATVDTSAAKGEVSVDLSALTGRNLAAGFKYVGGAGDDTLTVDAASFTATSGYKIDLGTGDDTLMLKGGANFTLTKAIASQFTGAEVLGLDMTNSTTATVDASLVADIKEFQFTSHGNSTGGALALSKVADGTTLEILGAHNSTNNISFAASSVSFGAGGIGKSLNLALTGGAAALDEVTMTTGAGLTVDCGNLVITSTKVAGSALTEDSTFAADANAIKITGVTGSNIVIKGDHTANIEFVGGTGVAVDGSAFTGHLKFTATAGADTIVGGAGNDTIVGKGGLDTLTGGAGKDMFDLSGIAADNAASGGVAASNLAAVKAEMAIITDFMKGDDSIKLNTNNSVTVTIDKATVTNFDTKLTTLLSANAEAVTVFQYDGATYIVNNVDTSTTKFSINDQIIKLDGLLDLTGASVDGSSILTWA